MSTAPMKTPPQAAASGHPDGPQAAYQQALQQGYTVDPAQQQVVAVLQHLHQRLIDQQQRRHWLPWRRQQAVTGLYLWGGVGRGKTWLMDLFFHSLPFATKRRVHFHHFMNEIHHQLKLHRHLHDPLPAATGAVIGQIRVLCFDEFFVSDIGDAMLLAGVLKTLAEQGVTLVATSNVAPDDLYRDGLQRARFLPAIELLKQQTQVVEMASGDDYRLQTLGRINTYHCPHDQAAETALAQCFKDIAGHAGTSAALTVNERPLTVVRAADGVVWFSFDQLCGSHRSASDYLVLAREYHTLLLSDIPCMGSDDSDAARRFIHLIDALYDHRVKLLASAAAQPTELYQGRRLTLEFERTASRLIEMRSPKYLAAAHRP
ncbi:MAG: cell division protein ZapE [Wenzhouxiangellaceae bacterium]